MVVNELWVQTLWNMKNANSQAGHSVSYEPFLQSVSGQPAENGDSLPQQVKAGPP